MVGCIYRRGPTGSREHRAAGHRRRHRPGGVRLSRSAMRHSAPVAF